MERELTEKLKGIDGVDDTAVMDGKLKIIDVFFRDKTIPLWQINEAARLLSCYGYSKAVIKCDPTINKVILSAWT